MCAPTGYHNVVTVHGKHTLNADEPASLGGQDQGPNPYEFILAGLGSCTSITLRMYANRRKFPLEKVEVHLSHDKVYREDCEACADHQEGAEGSSGSNRKVRIDLIRREITLHGDELTPDQRQKLLEIADKCPVHKTLEAGSVVLTSPREPGAELERKLGTKEVDLEGIPVYRLLPVASKRAVGPFCFVDHFGPNPLTPNTVMDVGLHPHIGLATLTYLLQGAIHHRDSTGANATIMPGEVNLMVAGRGAVHSERGFEVLNKVPEPRMLHGLQCWVALPPEEEECAPSFTHVPANGLPRIPAEDLAASEDVQATLIAGAYGGHSVGDLPLSWPMVMLDVELGAGGSMDLRVEPDQEVAVYCIQGSVVSGGTPVAVREAAVYSTPGLVPVTVDPHAEQPARFVVFGGKPLPHRLNMYWNFVSSDKWRIERAKEEWAKESSAFFPDVPGEEGSPKIPLPTRKRERVPETSAGKKRS